MAEAALERSLGLGLRELEVMEPRVAERRGEDVELYGDAGLRPKLYRFHPVAFDEVAWRRFIEGMGRGVLGSLPQPVRPHVRLEVGVGAADLPLALEVPAGGSDGDLVLGERDGDVSLDGVEGGFPPPLLLGRLVEPLEHLLDGVPVLSVFLGQGRVVWFHFHLFQRSQRCGERFHITSLLCG